MTKEGPQHSPAFENNVTPVSSYQVENSNIRNGIENSELQLIHTFVVAAKNLENRRKDPYHFGMTKQYRKNLETQYFNSRNELGITARRGTKDFEAVLECYENKLVEARFPAHWFGSEPKPLDIEQERLIYMKPDNGTNNMED